MQRDSMALGEIKIPRLFRIYLIPTLLGMVALCGVTATDGIFIGQGVGSEALAAVNICIPPTMLLMGIGLMLGIGASVVSSIHLANDNVKAARLNITQSLITGTIIVLLFLFFTLSAPEITARILGSSETLMPLVLNYMPWIFLCCLFQIWAAIGLFIVRLDGSPKYAMWCNVGPGLLNVVLDYLFIFPLDMGVAGAGIATAISCFAGFVMVVVYFIFFARELKLIRIKLSKKSCLLTLRNIGYQCKIGFSALLGEATMGMIMLIGNLVFMLYLGDDGVGAFSIACYYTPFAFMIGNAIAQSAQPIISFNYGKGNMIRVAATEHLAIYTAIVTGAIVTAVFVTAPKALVALFLDNSSAAAEYACGGLPLYSAAFVFFVFNLTAIGYFQSVEKVMASTVFALFRGLIFLIPSFILMPRLFGVNGIWLALFVSELLTTAAIMIYYCRQRITKPKYEIQR